MTASKRSRDSARAGKPSSASKAIVSRRPGPGFGFLAAAVACISIQDPFLGFSGRADRRYPCLSLSAATGRRLSAGWRAFWRFAAKSVAMRGRTLVGDTSSSRPGRLRDRRAHDDRLAWDGGGQYQHADPVRESILLRYDRARGLRYDAFGSSDMTKSKENQQ